MTLKKSHSHISMYEDMHFTVILQWLRIVFRHSVKWDPFNHFSMPPQVDYCFYKM